MEGDEDFGVPAGWYPDPLGLPQLRWWDGQSWTEFTSEAQAPVMMQPAPAVAEPVMAAAVAEPVVVEAATQFSFLADTQTASNASAVAAAAAGLLEANAFAETVVEPAAAEVAPIPAVLDVAPFEVAAAVPVEPVVEVAAVFEVPPVEQVFDIAPVESAQPAAAFAASAPIVAEEHGTVHSFADDLQFLTRRERREYERRLAAEAELFPGVAGIEQNAQPAAYIQQPVVPAASSAVETVAPIEAFVQPAVVVPYGQDPNIPIPPIPASYAADPVPALPEAQQPYLPEALFGHPLVQESSSQPATTFADLLAGEPVSPPPVPALPAASGVLALPADPSPYAGPTQVESSLSEILAEAALAPRPATAHVSAVNALPSGFSIEEAVLEEEPAPVLAAVAKKTATGSATFLSVLPAVLAGLAYLAVVVLGQSSNAPLVAVIWFGGLLLGTGLAGYDRLQLKASGHRDPASAWWAMLTPLVYLLLRWNRTSKETGKGLGLVLAALLATVVAGALIYLEPTIFTSVAPSPSN